MAGEQGFWLTADNGSSYYNMLSGGARAITYLQRIRIGPSRNNTSISTTITGKGANTTLLVVPITMYGIFEDSISLAVDAVGVNSIAVSGNVVTVNFNTYSGGVDIGGTTDKGWFLFDVYETINPTDSSYGFFIPDGTNFTGITDATRAGYCVYRTTVNIANGGTWTVPSGVQGRDKCSVFANWNSTTAVVEYTNNNKTIYVSRGSATLNIAVFSNGFTLTMPDYGFYLFNNSGQCTFNSAYIPMFIKNTVTVSGSDVATGVTKPMVCLGIYGGDSQKEGGTNWSFYNRGLIMSGSNIRSSRGKQTLLADTGGYQAVLPTASVPIVVLDGEQYFN